MYKRGRMIGRIIIANTVANLCFGRADWKTLFIVAQPRVYSIPLKVAGTPSLKKLQVREATGQMTLCWSAPSTGFQLESNTNLPSGAAWTNVTNVPSVTNGLNTVTLPTTNPVAFFRLNKPGT